MRTIGLVDVDLLDRGTRFPNLALMKLSSAHKARGNQTRLCLTRDDAQDCDALFCSKVFDFSAEPDWLADFSGRCYKGGTGYYGADSPKLNVLVEHSRPDYSLYRDYVEGRLATATSPKEFQRIDSSLARYTADSIGFTTRGCFRRCAFCVNRESTRSELWSPVEEFLDESRPFVSLLDDNVFACKDWRAVFSALKETKKMFSFRQGLDLRLMDEEKAKTLEEARYWGEVIFAFDNIADADRIREALTLYRRFCRKPTKCYLLCGFYEQGVDAIRSLLERIELISSFDVLPYVMRYRTCNEGALASVWSGLAAWCNQPGLWRHWNYFDVNSGRSKRATEGAERLPGDIVAKLRQCFWERNAFRNAERAAGR